MENKNELTASRFSMWRGVVVMIHADNVVTPQELCFINDYLRDLNLNSEQKEIIKDDLDNPRDAREIFAQITEEQDKIDFFALARAVAWCDGHFAKQEKAILQLLQGEHLTQDNMKLLKSSRESMNELDLQQDEWKFKTERSKSLFGFLPNRKYK